MPRVRRKQSEYGVYHIMLRGINKQSLFEDDEDRERFVEILKLYKKECGYEIYAWCIMGNHVHLVMKFNAFPAKEDSAKGLETAMKKIGVSYVYYFNKKYKRCGHLFQDRFKSEVISDDAYLYTVTRYVHMNPVRAGLCKKPEKYRWSSYNQYLCDGKRSERCMYRIADTKMVLSMCGIDELMRFTLEANDDKCLEMNDLYYGRIPDEEARDIIEKVSGCRSVTEFQELGLAERREYVTQLNNEGLNINQISRLTGVTRTVIYKAIK